MPKKKAAKKTALLTGDELSDELQTALEATFVRFDVDGDGGLSVPELQAFARVCNDGEEFALEELDDLRFFHRNDDGALTLKGFLQMYHTQTTARPADTWADLKALGFDGTLSLDEEAAAALARRKADAALTAPVQETTSVTELCDKSDALYTAGKADEALRVALAAVKLDGQRAEAHRCAGRALHSLGRLEMAERSWKRALELSADGSAAAAAIEDKRNDAARAEDNAPAEEGGSAADGGAAGGGGENGRPSSPMRAALEEAASALLGQRVELFGLSAAELNGRLGTAIAFDAARGRMAIEIDGVGRRSIKLTSVRPVANGGGHDGAPIPPTERADCMPTDGMPTAVPPSAPSAAAAPLSSPQSSAPSAAQLAARSPAGETALPAAPVAMVPEVIVPEATAPEASTLAAPEATPEATPAATPAPEAALPEAALPEAAEAVPYPEVREGEAPEAVPRSEGSESLAEQTAADGGRAFDELRLSLEALHTSRETLRQSTTGSREWAEAVISTDGNFKAAEQLLGAGMPALRGVRPEWRASPKAFEAAAAQVTDVLPNASSAWGLRGEACLLLPMGSSIAAEFFEKAEARALVEGRADAADGYARQKDAANARFLACLESAQSQIGP